MIIGVVHGGGGGLILNYYYPKLYYLKFVAILRRLKIDTLHILFRDNVNLNCYYIISTNLKSFQVFCISSEQRT